MSGRHFSKKKHSNPSNFCVPFYKVHVSMQQQRTRPRGLASGQGAAKLLMGMVSMIRPETASFRVATHAHSTVFTRTHAGSAWAAHQAARVGLGRDGPEVVAGHGDHDAPGGRVGAPGAHRAVRRERLVRAVLVVYALPRQQAICQRNCSS